MMVSCLRAGCLLLNDARWEWFGERWVAPSFAWTRNAALEVYPKAMLDTAGELADDDDGVLAVVGRRLPTLQTSDSCRLKARCVQRVGAMPVDVAKVDPEETSRGDRHAQLLASHEIGRAE